VMWSELEHQRGRVNMTERLRVTKKPCESAAVLRQDLVKFGRYFNRETVEKIKLDQ
jgi:hypothetical protein